METPAAHGLLPLPVLSRAPPAEPLPPGADEVRAGPPEAVAPFALLLGPPTGPPLPGGKALPPPGRALPGAGPTPFATASPANVTGRPLGAGLRLASATEGAPLAQTVPPAGAEPGPQTAPLPRGPWPQDARAERAGTDPLPNDAAPPGGPRASLAVPEPLPPAAPAGGDRSGSAAPLDPVPAPARPPEPPPRVGPAAGTTPERLPAADTPLPEPGAEAEADADTEPRGRESVPMPVGRPDGAESATRSAADGPRTSAWTPPATGADAPSRPVAPSVPSASPAPAPPAAGMAGDVAIEDLGARMALLVRERIGHATLRLDPPELGSLDIRLQLDDDRVSVQIVAGSAGTRELVEQGLPRLRELLAGGGLQLADAQVSQQHAGGERAPARYADAAAATATAPASPAPGPVGGGAPARPDGRLDVYA